MTNITKRLLLFFLVSLTVTQSCKVIQPVEIKDVENVSISSISLTSAEVEFDLVMHNSNIFSVNLLSADLSLFLNNTNTVKVKQGFDLKIPPNEDFTIPMNTTIYFKDLLSGSLSLILGAIEDKGQFSVTGEIVVKMVGIKKSIPISHTEVIN